MGEVNRHRAVIRVDYGNRSETWWEALSHRLETEPASVPAAVRQLNRPDGGDLIEVSAAEARAIVTWASTLPGWTGGPRHAPSPLRVEALPKPLGPVATAGRTLH
jgi:hypothetical protein